MKLSVCILFLGCLVLATAIPAPREEDLQNLPPGFNGLEDLQNLPPGFNGLEDLQNLPPGFNGLEDLRNLPPGFNGLEDLQGQLTELRDLVDELQELREVGMEKRYGAARRDPDAYRDCRIKCKKSGRKNSVCARECNKG